MIPWPGLGPGAVLKEIVTQGQLSLVIDRECVFVVSKRAIALSGTELPRMI